MKDVFPSVRDMKQIFFRQQRRKNLLPEHAVLTAHLNDKIVGLRRSIEESADRDERISLRSKLDMALKSKRDVEDVFFQTQVDRITDYMINQPDIVRLSRGSRSDREITTLNKRRPTLTLFDRYVALVLMRAFRVTNVGRDHVIRNMINAFRITLGASYASRSIIKIDIQEFFQSVDHEMLLSRLGAHPGVPRFALKHVRSVLGAYERIYGRQRGLPQGVPSSSVLSEIYFEKFDERLRQHPRVVLYARYVDDIVIVCHGNEIKNVQDIISEQLESLKLKINSAKSANIVHPAKASTEFTYLGYSFSFAAGSGQLRGLDISEAKYNRYCEALCRLEEYAKSEVCWSNRRDVNLFIGAFEYLVYPHHSKGDEDSPRIVTGLGYSARYVLQVQGPMPRISNLIRGAFHRVRPVVGQLLHGAPTTATCPCCGGLVVRSGDLLLLQQQKTANLTKILASNARPHVDDDLRILIRRLLWN